MYETKERAQLYNRSLRAQVAEKKFQEIRRVDRRFPSPFLDAMTIRTAEVESRALNMEGGQQDLIGSLPMRGPCHIERQYEDIIDAVLAESTPWCIHGCVYRTQESIPAVLRRFS